LKELLAQLLLKRRVLGRYRQVIELLVLEEAVLALVYHNPLGSEELYLDG